MAYYVLKLVPGRSTLPPSSGGPPPAAPSLDDPLGDPSGDKPRRPRTPGAASPPISPTVMESLPTTVSTGESIGLGPATTFVLADEKDVRGYEYIAKRIQTAPWDLPDGYVLTVNGAVRPLDPMKNIHNVSYKSMIREDLPPGISGDAEAFVHAVNTELVLLADKVSQIKGDATFYVFRDPTGLYILVADRGDGIPDPLMRHHPKAIKRTLLHWHERYGGAQDEREPFIPLADKGMKSSQKPDDGDDEDWEFLDILGDTGDKILGAVIIAGAAVLTKFLVDAIGGE